MQRIRSTGNDKFDKTVTAFLQGKPKAFAGSRFWTDGQRFYSYAMVIGERRADGVIEVAAVVPSATTRNHVHALLSRLKIDNVVWTASR
jgi:hypothetical protein